MCFVVGRAFYDFRLCSAVKLHVVALASGVSKFMRYMSYVSCQIRPICEPTGYYLNKLVTIDYQNGFDFSFSLD